MRRIALAGLLAVMLGGCAGLRLIDNQVTAFAPQAVPAGARYRFERLPSQQAEATAQQQLESLAEHALSKVGLRRDDAQATLTVEVAASERVQRIDAESHWGVPHGWTHGHPGGALFPGLGERTFYWRELSLIVRDAASHAVLFESHARNDSPWSDTPAVLPALLDAALAGFPAPPTGARQVRIEIPR